MEAGPPKKRFTTLPKPSLLTLAQFLAIRRSSSGVSCLCTSRPLFAPPPPTLSVGLGVPPPSPWLDVPPAGSVAGIWLGHALRVRAGASPSFGVVGRSILGRRRATGRWAVAVEILGQLEPGARPDSEVRKRRIGNTVLAGHVTRSEPTRIREAQRAIPHITVRVPALREPRPRHQRVGRHEPPDRGIVNPPLHVHEPQLVVLLPREPDRRHHRRLRHRAPPRRIAPRAEGIIAPPLGHVAAPVGHHVHRAERLREQVRHLVRHARGARHHHRRAPRGDEVLVLLHAAAPRW